MADFRPKIGLPGRVTGALGKEDVIRLQELKQEFLDEKVLERVLAQHKHKATCEVHKSKLDEKSLLYRYDKQAGAMGVRLGNVHVSEKSEQIAMLEELAH